MKIKYDRQYIGQRSQQLQNKNIWHRNQADKDKW